MRPRAALSSRRFTGQGGKFDPGLDVPGGQYLIVGGQTFGQSIVQADRLQMQRGIGGGGHRVAEQLFGQLGHGIGAFL